jgi:hypothetical protein
MTALEVSDSLSNTEEQIERAAKTLGRSIARKKVFDKIYHHKAKVKTVSEVVAKTKLPRIRVLQEGRHLSRKGIVRQTTKDGETAYEKIDFFHAHKQQILGLAGNPKKLAALPTKRKIRAQLTSVVTIPSAGAKAKRITVDDVASFARIRRLRLNEAAQTLPSSMSEAQFKRGVQRIIGEPGKFKDWGGEKSDLYTTRIRLTDKRLAAAFAFKGPGQKGKLVIGRMGKNGDQALRLFQEEADVFFVQHWREIDSSIIDLMRNLAIAKSATTGRPVWYGIMDGNDSNRLVLAYPTCFRRQPAR